MKPSTALAAHREAIRLAVTRHRGANPRVFGSVACGLDTEMSDLDLLVDPMARMSLFNLAALQLELEALLTVRVDVFTPNSLPDSFRALVLAEARPV